MIISYTRVRSVLDFDEFKQDFFTEVQDSIVDFYGDSHLDVHQIQQILLAQADEGGSIDFLGLEFLNSFRIARDLLNERTDFSDTPFHWIACGRASNWGSIKNLWILLPEF